MLTLLCSHPHCWISKWPPAEGAVGLGSVWQQPLPSSPCKGFGWVLNLQKSALELPLHHLAYLGLTHDSSQIFPKDDFRIFAACLRLFSPEFAWLCFCLKVLWVPCRKLPFAQLKFRTLDLYNTAFCHCGKSHPGTRLSWMSHESCSGAKKVLSSDLEDPHDRFQPLGLGKGPWVPC